jgi:uncharacterized protein
MSDAKSPPELSMDAIIASVQRIIAEDQPSSAPPFAKLETEGATDDILELTEAISEDGSVRHLAPFALLSSQPIDAVEPPDDPRSPPSTPPVSSRGPLDDDLRELLRPMLQAWVDEHLPAVVERIVAAEVARVVGRAGPA